MEKRLNAISKTCYYHIRNAGVSQGLCWKLWLLPSQHQGWVMEMLSCMASQVPWWHNCWEYRILQPDWWLSQKGQHITPVLNSLNWLPLINRSKYKILVYAYKTLIGNDFWCQSPNHWLPKLRGVTYMYTYVCVYVHVLCSRKDVLLIIMFVKCIWAISLQII